MKLWLVELETDPDDYGNPGEYALLAVCTMKATAERLALYAYGNAGPKPLDGITVREIESGVMLHGD